MRADEYITNQIKEDRYVYLGSRCVIIFVLILGFMEPSSGAVFTWDGVGAADANWSTKQNWAGNTAPSGTGHDLIFTGSSRLANTNDALTSVNSITFDSTAGAFILSGNSLNFGVGNTGITNNSSSLQTINMALGLNATITLAATSGNIAIGGVISGSNGITKTGSNSLTLTAANTYTGTTTISEGTLLANNTTGSATGTGAVSVTGTLGGTGTITPTGTNGITVNSGGIIAPGAAGTTGQLNINLGSTTGNMVMSSGAGFQFHLAGAGLNINSPGVSDTLAFLNASSGDVAFNNNTINFLGTGAVGFYKIFDTSSDNSNTWTGLTVNGSGQITSGLTASNLSSGLSAIFIMGGLSYGGTSGDIYVQVIPEPSSVLLGGLGATLLLLRRRRTA